MKILITGNMGYVGPSVLERLRSSYPEAELVGLDMGYFADCLTNVPFLPECRADIQYFSDVRLVQDSQLQGVSAIVHLSAISNDPMGKTYERPTYDINHKASVALAQKAKALGVKTFVFACSCSMYGLADDTPRKEDSDLNPLTAYAKSKNLTEQGLREIADENFKVTSLRFATACGMSERLRLDLVLNDFVACAISSGNISILSDGTPWRPLIHVKDMARAIDWGISRNAGAGGHFLAVNAGSSEWNYQVRDLAEAVAAEIPGVSISINKDAQPDKRSYRVNFDLFKALAPAYTPQVDLATAVRELKAGLEGMGFCDNDFRNSSLMRLKKLDGLRSQGFLNEQLEWTHKTSSARTDSGANR